MSVHGNIIVFTLCLVALAAPAFSQNAQPCAERGKLTEHLSGKYKESQTGAGLQSGTRIVEVWASEGGSWTIVSTDPRGVSCILASGTHWRDIEPPVELSGIPG